MVKTQSPVEESASRGQRILAGMATLAYTYPYAIIVVGTLLCVLGVWYAQKTMYFDADQANLIRRSAELQSSQDRYVREFPNAEDLVVIVEQGTKDQRQAFIDDLAKRLRAEPQVFDNVFEKVEVSFLQRYALQYVDVPMLKDIATNVEQNLDVFEKLSSSRSLAQLFEQLDTANFAQDSAIEATGLLLPVINGFIDLFQQSMETRGRYVYVSPWSMAAGGDNDAAAQQSIPPEMLQTGTLSFYSTLADDRVYILLARPKYSKQHTKAESLEIATKRMREILAGLERSHTEVMVGLTGEPVLDIDQGECSSRDSMDSTVWSLVLVALVFAWAFREVYRPLMAVFTLMIGVGWTVGFTAIAVGHLNLLTVTFATILIGLGIDFGIHFIYRYDEERFSGLDCLPAMQVTLMGAGLENFTGALSTAIAFWVLLFTDFVGIGELGVIAGTGVMLCYLAMGLVLPSMMFLQERYGYAKKPTGLVQFGFLVKAERFWLDHCNVTVIVCSLLTLWCLWQARTVKYDYNLLNLQAKGLESVRTELHLMNMDSYSLLHGISLASNVAEAGRLMEAYEKLPLVAKVESAARMIPADYGGKKPYLKRIIQAMAQIPPPNDKSDSSVGGAQELRSMGEAFEKTNAQIDALVAKLKNSSDPQVRRNVVKFEKSLHKLFDTLSSMGPGPIEDGLRAFERDFFQDFHRMFEFLKLQVDGPALDLKDLPSSLSSREVGREGSIQVRIFPKENVWEREPLERFVKSMQTVDPQVIGMPVVMYYDCQELRNANERAGMYALVAIWVLILLHFRGIRMALLALFPKVIGVVWMVGIMGYIGVDFNSANFLALPLILGIGLVFGVHVVHRVCEEGGDGIFAHSTGPSIYLAAITTMIGFGTLMAGEHQGVRSLGIIMTTGVGANLLTAVVFLPAVMKWLHNKGSKMSLH